MGKKKGFFKKLIENFDKKLEEKSKTQCCCSCSCEDSKQEEESCCKK